MYAQFGGNEEVSRQISYLKLRKAASKEELRRITMDAVGTFAEAVGKDALHPYFADMMGQAFNGIQVGGARLKECSFLFFSEEEFAPYLPEVVKALFQSYDEPDQGDEERPVSARPSCADRHSSWTAANFASGLTPSSAINVSDDVNVEEVNLDSILEASTGIYIEKEIAADTIGTVFAATKTHFLPYVEQCTLKLLALLPHFYEGIRKSATDSLLEITRTFYELSEPKEWQPGYTVSWSRSTTRCSVGYADNV